MRLSRYANPLLAATLVSAAVAALALWSLAFPGYSDEQIAASLVDTWEADSTANFALAALSLVLLLWASISLYLHRRIRSLSGAAFLCAALALGLTVLAQEVSTARASRVQGHQLERVWGLVGLGPNNSSKPTPLRGAA
ncbi:hypothetical protein PAGU2595_028880 [Lysobacter xanthus]